MGNVKVKDWYLIALQCRTLGAFNLLFTTASDLLVPSDVAAASLGHAVLQPAMSTTDIQVVLKLDNRHLMCVVMLPSHMITATGNDCL